MTVHRRSHSSCLVRIPAIISQPPDRTAPGHSIKPRSRAPAVACKPVLAHTHSLHTPAGSRAQRTSNRSSVPRSAGPSGRRRGTRSGRSWPKQSNKQPAVGLGTCGWRPIAAPPAPEPSDIHMILVVRAYRRSEREQQCKIHFIYSHPQRHRGDCRSADSQS